MNTARSVNALKFMGVDFVEHTMLKCYEPERNKMFRKKEGQIFSQGVDAGYKYAIASLREAIPLDPEDVRFAERAADFLELPQHEYLVKWHLKKGKNASL